MKYTVSTANRSTNKTYVYQTTNFQNKQTFWLASPCIFLFSNECYFNVRVVDSGSVYGFSLFYSDRNGYDVDSSVVPVVSLKSNIQTSGQTESGEWNLVVE